jgi:mono/diheme cytochrome c family protein
MKIIYLSPPLIALLLAASGCGSGKQATSAKAKNESAPQAPVKRVSFSELAVAPKPDVTPQLLERGKTIYGQNCAACHGIKGDGNGDAAAFLLPKPRSFVEAKYRLRSTPTGQLPTDVDLFRSVSLGLPGTPMPPWKHSLSEDDRWAVVEYIKSFSSRFSDPNENNHCHARDSAASNRRNPGGRQSFVHEMVLLLLPRRIRPWRWAFRPNPRR